MTEFKVDLATNPRTMASKHADIRRRIKSVKNTAQITKAMQMVAASKMRKAQAAALAGRPYADLMNRVLVSLSRRTNPELQPAAGGARGEERTGPDRQHRQRPLRRSEYQFAARDPAIRPGRTRTSRSGKKAVQFLARTRKDLLADFHLKDAPALLDTKPISKFLIEKFLGSEVDKVSVLYTRSSTR